MRRGLYILGLLCMALVCGAMGVYVLPDDVYATKSESAIDYMNAEESMLKDTKEDVSVQEADGERRDILIADPQLETYTEGFIVYQGADGRKDTVYVYGSPEDYFTTEKTDSLKIAE